jgi:hypothetical protein
MGFIDFTSGQVLTADQMDLVMRQSVMVFDDASDRNTQLSGVLAEGMLTYLKDTNTVEQYDGSSFGPVDTTISELNAKAINTDLNTESGATRTLNSADANTYLQLTDEATVTVSTGTDFAVGDQVTIICDGTPSADTPLTITTDGATIAGAGTSTTSGSFTVGAQYEAVSILCVATDDYRIIGNITVVE